MLAAGVAPALPAGKSRRDLERYGFNGWQPPDASDNLPPFFGGGDVGNDALYAAQAAELIERASARRTSRSRYWSAWSIRTTSWRTRSARPGRATATFLPGPVHFG